jgi:nickel superoxide dismutase
MKEITRLSADGEKSYNQIVRWVNNKELHADEFSHIITYYFMAQRIKPVAKEETDAYREYQHRLTLLHELLIFAMKAKQTTDLVHVEKLRSLVADFRTAYFGSKFGK